MNRTVLSLGFKVIHFQFKEFSIFILMQNYPHFLLIGPLLNHIAFIDFYQEIKRQCLNIRLPLLIFLFLVIQLMGCTPPEKRHTSVPIVNVVPRKVPNLSPRTSDNSKSSTHNNDSNNLQIPIPSFPSGQSLKNRKKSSQGKVTLQKKKSLENPKRFSYEQQDFSSKAKEKEIIRIIEPTNRSRQRQSYENQQLLKPLHINSLDLISKIKVPREAEKKKKQSVMKISSKVEQINITFNNNDFGVAESKNGLKKKWREEILVNELKFMNSEDFQQININSRNFN